jgi:precorrin-2 dehydrogenase
MLMLPLFLNLTGRLGVVVGGGRVARRKATALREGGAEVRLVCLEPMPAGEEAPGLEWRTEPYRAEHLDGANLVFAAAVPEVNRRVVADAGARGLWVNCADDPQGSDFYMPAVVRRGGLTIAIGTSGAAPALAHEIRVLLENQFDEAFGRWVGLLAELRSLVLDQIPEPDRRRALLERLCRWEWLERLRRQGEAAVRAAMLAEVAALVAPDEPGI